MDTPSPTQTLSALASSARGFVVYRLLISDASPLGAVVEFVTDSICEIMGVREPTDFTSWFAAVHPDDLPRVMDAQHHARRTGQPFDEEMRVVIDGAVRWVHARSHPVFDAEGAPVAFAGLIIDVTERMRLRQTAAAISERLHTSQRTDALVELSARVAHDVNNLLQGVMAMATLHQHIDSGSRRSELIEDIIELAARGGQTTRDLLGYAAEPAVLEADTDLAEVAARAVRVARRMFPALTIALDAEPTVAHVDEAPIEQALLNLLINAAHATERAGSVSVRVGRAQGMAVVSVADDGCGILPAHLPRITEPYFTTRGAQGGTGLGLTSVRLTASRYGGQLLVDSVPGEGARFALVLPIVAAPASSDHALQPVPPGTRLLLVEDDPLLRDSLARLLPMYGLEVTAAAGLGEVEAARLDLAVVDLNLTRGSAPELLRQLHARWPGLPLVVISDGITEVVEGAELLHKPFHLDDLLASIGRALAQPASDVPATA